MYNGTTAYNAVQRLRRSFLCGLFRRSGYKNVIEKFLIIVCVLNLPGSCARLEAQRLSRDQQMGLFTNQVGYRPLSTKTCLVQGREKRDFEVVEITRGQVAYRGSLVPRQGDFGPYTTADFSKLEKEGRYYLRTDTIRSFPFSISCATFK